MADAEDEKSFERVSWKGKKAGWGIEQSQCLLQLQVSYYRRFIRHFAAIANPLLEKLKKSDLKDDEEFEVTPAMENAFKELKRRLLKAPILAHPRFDDLEKNPFIVTVDWSENEKMTLIKQSKITVNLQVRKTMPLGARSNRK